MNVEAYAVVRLAPADRLRRLCSLRDLRDFIEQCRLLGADEDSVFDLERMEIRLPTPVPVDD